MEKIRFERLPEAVALLLEKVSHIIKIEANLEDIAKKKYTIAQLAPIVEKAILTLINLSAIFDKSALNDKRRLIGSMFSEKFDFEALQHRTALLIEIFSRI